MRQYLTRRLIQMIPILIGISVIIFGLFALAPGDFIDANMSMGASQERIDELKALYGFDKPLPVRYINWVSNTIRGNLGLSLQFMKPVTEVIDDYVWNSFILASIAYMLSILIAVPVGVLSATKQYSKFDMGATVFALMGIAMPSFFLGLLLIKFFAIDLPIFPVSGMSTAGANNTGLAHILDVGKHLILPSLVLGLTGVGSLMRHTRTAMLEVIRQDYIRTARAKGLGQRTVIYRHALRNALIPVVTILGMMLPSLFGGAIITEQIFAYPGIGRIALMSLSKRDYPLLMGFNMMLAALTLLGNLLSDILYAAVDPRVRLK